MLESSVDVVYCIYHLLSYIDIIRCGNYSHMAGWCS